MHNTHTLVLGFSFSVFPIGKASARGQTSFSLIDQHSAGFTAGLKNTSAKRMTHSMGFEREHKERYKIEKCLTTQILQVD